MTLQLILIALALQGGAFNSGAADRHPTPQVVPALRELTAESRRLIQYVDQPGSAEQLPAFMALADRPDWQTIADHLVERIRDDPNGSHNNTCLALGFVVKRHLDDIELDIDPLLGLLSTLPWTNQQKAAGVLAVAAQRVELFAGNEERAIRLAIPLTTSQRGRVVSPVLRILHALTDEKELGRDPAAWVGWYEKRYQDKIDLRGSVYELLAIVHPRDKDGKRTYQLNAQTVGDVAGLGDALESLSQAAATHALRAVPVVVVNPEVLEDLDMARIYEVMSEYSMIFARAGMGLMTVAPATDVFYPPYEAGFPAMPEAEGRQESTIPP